MDPLHDQQVPILTAPGKENPAQILLMFKTEVANIQGDPLCSCSIVSDYQENTIRHQTST